MNICTQKVCEPTRRSKPERIGDESRAAAEIVFVHGCIRYFAGTASRYGDQRGGWSQ